VFKDTDGSAYFKGSKIQPASVAEVVPRKSAKPNSHNSHNPVKTLKAGLQAGIQTIKNKFGPGTKSSGSSRRVSSRGSSGSHGSSSLTARQKRKLFNFKDVPHGVNGVGLRKHSFREKHHGLVSKFVNANAKVTLVIVVDTFLGPRGRPSRMKGDTRKRGSRESEINIKGLKHKNLFVFDEKGKRLFPSSGSRSSGSSSRRHPSSGSSRNKAKGGKERRPSMMDKVKEKVAGFKNKLTKSK